MSEVQALEILLSRVKIPSFIINKVEPMSFARTSYLNVGDSMNIDVMIAAYDTTNISKIRYGINDSIRSNWKEIKGKLPVHATNPGQYTVFGEISVKENGMEKWKPFKYQYEVGQPMGTVANEDLTIIYAGFDHTFSAAASGFPQDKISLNVPGARVTPLGGGKFNVVMDARKVGQRIKSTITARTDDGVKTLAGPEFLVKGMPKPFLSFGSISSSESKVTVQQLIANMPVGVRAGYDESVPINGSKVKFKVVSYEAQIQLPSGQKVTDRITGGKVSKKIEDGIKVMRSGMRIIFTDVNVTTNGIPMRVPTMTFEIK